jgi:hypothetical protein
MGAAPGCMARLMRGAVMLAAFALSHPSCRGGGRRAGGSVIAMVAAP